MLVTKTPLNGLLIIEPKCYGDERGFFLETYQKERYQEAGIEDAFIQDNQSRSVKGVLRGLHFQVKTPQAQIVTVMRGEIFDVCVDLRQNSQTFGMWFGARLSDSGPRQIYMAPGFAHGFCVLSEFADLHYKVSQKYNPNDEGGLHWNDPHINIKWPIQNPVVSNRDNLYLNFNSLNSDSLPCI
jgi:dTDP-4-dehydrorhamnose 3,5-epimerase